MTTLTTTHLPRTPVRPTSGGIFGTVLATLGRWNRDRVTRKALSQLSDHQLDDIGLTRSDIARL